MKLKVPVGSDASKTTPDHPSYPAGLNSKTIQVDEV